MVSGILGLLVAGGLAVTARGGTAARSTAARSTAAKSTAAKSTAAKSAAVESAVTRVERTILVMGTPLRIDLEATDRASALAATEAAIAAVEAAEARLSTWRQDSELARLNQVPIGRSVALSAALEHDLIEASACSAATGGAFDPTVGALVDAWDLRGAGRLPSRPQLARALAATGLPLLRLSSGHATRLHGNLRIEEGGFGKGAGLAQALAATATQPRVRRAAFDIGGQVAFYSGTEEAVAWTVRIADPRDRARAVLALEVDGGSLATTGNSERAIDLDGRRLGHVLDPSTGRPAADFGSVTVWAPGPLRADCLSTALFVMGPEAALDWAAAAPDVEAIVLTVEGDRLRFHATNGFDTRIQILAADLEAASTAHRSRRSEGAP